MSRAEKTHLAGRVFETPGLRYDYGRWMILPDKSNERNRFPHTKISKIFFS